MTYTNFKIMMKDMLIFITIFIPLLFIFVYFLALIENPDIRFFKQESANEVITK